MQTRALSSVANRVLVVGEGPVITCVGVGFANHRGEGESAVYMCAAFIAFITEVSRE